MARLLLRPHEAGQLLGVCRTKVYAMLASGELPSVRIGSSIRVPLEALRRWVHDRTTEDNPNTGEPRD